MHWVLDVNFREDDSRTRERTLGNNLSWLRRFAVTLLKRHPDKDSLRGKMMSCMLNTDYLTQVLSPIACSICVSPGVKVRFIRPVEQGRPSLSRCSYGVVLEPL